MKVLNIVKYYYPSLGGMETYVRQICSGMRKHKIETNVITINNFPHLATTREIIDEVPVLRVACQLKLFSQPVSISFGHEMKRLILETDLVHLHCPFPNAEILSNSFASKPLVVTWCADPVNTRWNKLFPLFRSPLIRVLEMARKIILIGPNLLEHSPTLQPYQHKCDVIPLAYSDANGSNTKSKVRKIKSVSPIILFVGKLRKYKGVEFLIRAMPLIPKALLHIVGNGEEMMNLRKLTNNLGIDYRVSFLADVTNEELFQEYRNADIFVLPSIDASEAFGIVQAEAMSYGLPVVNTNLPSSVPYVSLDGVSGITVPPHSPEALAVAINRLCDDQNLYQNCSRNALKRAKLFSEKNLIDKYIKVYSECV